MIVEDIKKLYRFLKELGVYRQFISSTDNNFPFHRYGTFKSYCENIRRRDAIQSSFLWAGTKQGKEFWLVIHRCWADNDGKITDRLIEALKSVDLSKNYK